MAAKFVVRQIKENIREYLSEHQLEVRFNKALSLIENNIRHPSLNVEVLEPKHLKVYSFRVDQKYRAIFIFIGNEIEILTVSNHYK